MKIKNLLAYIEKEKKAGNLSDESTLEIALPIEYHRIEDKKGKVITILGESFSLDVGTIGAMINCEEFVFENGKSESLGRIQADKNVLTFEPKIIQYSRIMKGQFQKNIPILDKVKEYNLAASK